MRVRLLGPTEIEGGPALGPRDRVVLGALLVRPGDPLSAEQLADALWGDAPPASWAKVVQGCISRLRRALTPGAILTVPTGYRLRPDAVEVDREEFESLVARGRSYAASGSPEQAVAFFEQALALWQGRALSDLDEWEPGRLEATRLDELRLSVVEDLLQARLDAGDHRAVVAAAKVAVGEEPFRERRWALLALAQYRGGRQAEALGSIRTARRMLGSELGLDPGSDLVLLERSILDQDPSLTGDRDLLEPHGECPWKGLSSYAASDQDTFFGRAAEIAAAQARLERHPLLVLTGPSGSGKSSLMLAGLAPALVRRGRQVVSFTPGIDPPVAMSTARMGVPGDPVLLIDQFEETFTLTGPSSDPAGWLAELATYADTRAPVVVTLRADQMVHLTLAPGFARLAEHGVLLVAPLQGASLREAIEEPARRAGLRLEHGLVDLMIRDTEGQPGALPLLSHALVETWRRRERGLLTVDGYRLSGGLRGAVAASADRLYESLSLPERAQLRRLMLRMVSLSDGGEPVRATLSAASVADDPARRRVLDRLARARLVTTDQDTFELAHEALARAWPRLRTWLDEGVEEQQLLRHLAASAAGWDALGRPDSELYRGARLHGATEWLSQDDADPTPLERDFLTTSQARADDARLETERQISRERRQNRRLRSLLAGATALLVVAAAAGAFAVDRSHTADSERDAARASARTARHESLVGRSLTLRSSNQSVAALLAVEAWRDRPDALAESALLGSFTSLPGFLGYRRLSDVVQFGAGIPGSDSVVTAAGSRVRILDPETGDLGPDFETPLTLGSDVYSVIRVSADGSRVAQLIYDTTRQRECGTFDALADRNGRGCTLLLVFDVASRALVLGPVVTPFSGGDVALAADGGLVAVTGGLDGDLATYDVDTGRHLGNLAGLPRPEGVFLQRDTGAVVFGPDDHVFLGSMAGPIREVAARSMQVVRRLPAPELSSHNNLFLTEDGVLVAAGDQAQVAIDLASGRRRWTVDLRDEPADEPCPFFTVAQEVGRTYCGNYFGQLEERDLRTGDRTGVKLDPQLGVVGELVVTGGGRELVSFAGNSSVYARWRIDGTGLDGRLIAPGLAAAGGYDSSGTRLLAGPRGDGSSDRVLDLDGRVVARLPVAGVATWVGPDTVAVLGARTELLFDVRTGTSIDPAVFTKDSQGVFAEPDGRFAWVANGFPNSLQRFDVSTGAAVGDPIDLLFVQTVNVDADGRSVLVTHTTEQDWLTTRFDLDSGRALGSGMPGIVRSVVSEDGTALGADASGDLTEFAAKDLAPVAKVPGARSAPSSLQLSRDGRRLVVTSPDQSVQVIDVATRTRLGDALRSQSPDGTTGGWLRPDGLALVVNGDAGIVEWSLDPERLLRAACTLAGRNLTRTEWATYVGDVPYARTCPDQPAGA